MHLTSDQTLPLTLVKTSANSSHSNAQSCSSSLLQTSQQMNYTEQTLAQPPQNQLLDTSFKYLAYIGQMGSAVIAVALAIELASSLTIVMAVLGILWFSCEHFTEADS